MWLNQSSLPGSIWANSAPARYPSLPRAGGLSSLLGPGEPVNCMYECRLVKPMLVPQQ
ncbi:hypothetical protein Ancab_029258 [Ancistrocladus abbreviatus]